MKPHKKQLSRIRTAMKKTHPPFITIGSKGTSLPTELTKLDPPLCIGENGYAVNQVNWSSGPYKKLGLRADAWVSKAREPFRILPLDQAITEGLVVHIAEIAWTSKGQRFSGEAFFPASSKTGDKPDYVAVRAAGWNHGCLEFGRNKGNRGEWVGTFGDASIVKRTQQHPNGKLRSLNQPPIPSASMSDPVSIEEEIEQHLSSFAHEPETTRQAVIEARRGQGPFRQTLKKLWRSRCAATPCNIIGILQASHIKPWREASNRQRLDPFNGLLLTPNLHAAFDSGLISFRDDGNILLSQSLTPANAEAIGLHSGMCLHQVFSENKLYLDYHRRLHGFQSLAEDQ